MANEIAIKRESNGDLALFVAGDVLLVDGIDRQSGSGNLVIGSTLIATEELRLSSVAGLARVMGDLALDGVFDGAVGIGGGDELRLWDVGDSNYVGFEAPALTGNQIWILPAVDSTGTQYMRSDGAGNLSWGNPSGSGTVTGPGTHADNVLPRWNGVDSEALQNTGITIGDTDIVDGVLRLDFSGATTTLGSINLPDEGSIFSYGGAASRRFLKCTGSALFLGENGAGAEPGGIEAFDIEAVNNVDISLTSSDTVVWSFQPTYASCLAELEMNNNDIDNIKTAVFNGVIANGSMGTTQTIDWTAGQKQSGTQSAACTVTFTAPLGPCNLIMELTNGGAFAFTWPATVQWPNGTEPSWTTSGVDVVAFYYNGTNYKGVMSPDFSAP